MLSIYSELYRKRTMFQNTDKPKLEILLPISLLLLPVLMQLLPLVVETPPRRGLYYTPTIIQLFKVAVILFVISTGVTKNTQRPLPKPMLVAALVLVAVIIYSTLFRAQNVTYSAEKILDLVSIILLAILCSSLFEKSRINLAALCLVAIFWSIVIAIPVMAILFILQLPENNLWPNFMPGFTFVRIYGFALAAAIALGIGLLTFEKPAQFAPKILILPALVLLWAALFWSSTRGGIFSLIGVNAVFFIAFPKFRRAALIGMAMMVLGAGISIFIPAPSDAYGFFNAFNDSFQADSANRFSAGRVEMWQIMLGQIADKPFFGYGYGQTTLLTPQGSPPRAHTHNIVIEAAQSWGWIGAIAAGYLILHSWLRGLIKTWQSKAEEKLPAFFLISVMAVFAWVDGVYFYYQSLIPIAICVAVVMANSRLDRRN